MTGAETPIRGKVARILDSRQLAINVGAADGVKPGMRFDVMDPKGEDIRDPDTGDVLGSIERPKVRVQVTQVKERLSVASTFRKKRVNVGGMGIDLSPFARAFDPPKYVTRMETFKTHEHTWEDLDESQSYVKVGDPVIQVIDDVEEEEG